VASPKLLQSLQTTLSHLNRLEILIPYRYDGVERHNGCKPEELLESLGQFNCLTVLRIYNALDLLTCAVTFPPNITELTLSSLKRISDEGMNGLGNLTKLKTLRLLGELNWSGDSFDLNCVGGSFPQLEVFEMENLKVGKWKLGNGAMPRLQSVIINYCEGLDDLPSELWSLSGLRKVHVTKPSEKMAVVLRNLEINNGVQIVTEDHQQMNYFKYLTKKHVTEGVTIF